MNCVESDELKLALRRFARGVTIITTIAEGSRHGMAATAVSEMSLDPCSMAICVNQSASLHPILKNGAAFAINILHASQRDVAENCYGSVKGESRFSLGQWGTGLLGVPYLIDAQAAILCRNVQSLTYGTHSLFIGEVVDVKIVEDINPLAYLNGVYGRFAPLEEC